MGAVCSREERVDGQKRLYIMTLGCLAPYRRLGIGIRVIFHHTTQLIIISKGDVRRTIKSADFCARGLVAPKIG